MSKVLEVVIGTSHQNEALWRSEVALMLHGG